MPDEAGTIIPPGSFVGPGPDAKVVPAKAKGRREPKYHLKKPRKKDGVDSLEFDEAVDDVVEESCRDEIFYTNSGGGVTLSGGEPLSQPEFSRLFLKACKDRSIHTTLDTSGHGRWQVMKGLLEYTDLVLFDLKHLSPDKHLEGTQAGNDLILENLRKTLDSNGVKVWIRVPVIAGYNDADSYVTELALVMSEMRAAKVSLLGYHEWGRPKYEALGREYFCDKLDALPKARLESMKRVIEARGIEVTIDH